MPDFAELWGGTVERSADGTVWSDVEKVTGVTVPAITKTFRDRTSMDTASKVREYGGGFADTGEASITAFFTAAGFAKAKEDEDRADGTYYRVTLDDGSAFTFLAIVTASLDSLEMDADAMITISGKVSGEIAYTAAA
ncbi:phage tail tube protein [Mangrovicoccus sp. HB161399]|uniref:phage tail tube protein n=1 Tax=Mangrovicoccus sp. HB161399 TaxID=2720392 RepID=UPI001557A1D3|nr:phage tail tube protein [Mangrovicoccus sp. HB161399]